MVAALTLTLLWYRFRQTWLHLMLYSRRIATSPERLILVLLVLPSVIALGTLTICALLLETTFAYATALAALLACLHAVLALGLTFCSNEETIETRLNLLRDKVESAQAIRSGFVEARAIQREERRKLREQQARQHEAAREVRRKKPVQATHASGLLTCSDCGSQVSRRAKTCPHCGGPIKGGSGYGLTAALLLMIVLVCAGICTGILSEGDGSSRSHQSQTERLAFPDPNEFRGYGPPSLDRDRRILRDLRTLQDAVKQVESASEKEPP